MVTTQGHGEQDRYGHWFPPFEPVAAPDRAAPPAPEPSAPDAPPSPDPSLGAEGGQAPEPTPDFKAPAAADEPFASRDAPTPTWLAADEEQDTAVSPKKRKVRPPKAPKTPKASPAPTAPPQPPAAEVGPTIAEPAPYSEPPQKKSKRPILIGALGAAAALAVGAVVIAVAGSPGMLGSDGSAEASGPTTIAATAAAVDDYCIESTDGNTITSNRPGDQSSGPNVILAFEYAYYVERDGEQAYALAAPGALAVEADDIQDGIDQAPVDTDYCATITETAPDRFTLDLAVRMSPTSDENYRMYITTTEIDGKSFITRMGSTP